MSVSVENKNREQRLKAIFQWAEENQDVKAVLLTSSFVNPLAPVDDFSDLDIELIFEDNSQYVKDTTWLDSFGKAIAMIEEDERCFEGKHAMKMVLYEDGGKVDFKLYSKKQFMEETQLKKLPADWDIGYKVLIDKEQLTARMLSPTYEVSIIQKPTEKDFQKLINDFWWDTTYVVKCLKREDIFYAKYMSETIIRTEYLIPLIEWHIASQHQWNVTTNKYGRLFKKYLDGDEWMEIEKTFSGSDIEENWNALFAMAELVSKIGRKLAEILNYQYPYQLEKDILHYMRQIKLQ